MKTGSLNHTQRSEGFGKMLLFAELSSLYLFLIFLFCMLWGIVGICIAGRKNAEGWGFLLGFFLGPLGVIFSAFLDCRHKCPYCGGRINSLGQRNTGYSICQHCANDLVWLPLHGPATPSEAESIQREKDLRTIEDAERSSKINKPLEEPDQDVVNVHVLTANAWINCIRNLPGKVDSILQKVAGEGNDIVLWFLRVILVVLLVSIPFAGIFFLIWVI